jgi:predicted ATPase
MSHLSLSLLGPLQILLDGQPLTGIESNKARALLVYLVVEADRPHSREALIGLLWPDQPDAVARTNLRQALANVRQVLGDRTTETPFLLITRETVQFNAHSDYSLDVATFISEVSVCERHVHRRADACHSCARRMEQALDLHRGDFLEQFHLNGSIAFDEWILNKRERLHRLALNRLHCLAEYHSRCGAHDRAYACAVRQLELDPWREEAHRQAMRALALSGQRSAALAQYETCRHILAHELGAEPALETMQLRDEIRSGSLRATDSSSHLPPELPTSTTDLVGREHDLLKLIEIIESPSCRLLTLVGSGGIGKTRLATQIATDVRGMFADGVYFTTIASADATPTLIPSIANTLNLTLSGQKDPLKQLLDHLRHTKRQVLLVLDGFEHVLRDKNGANLIGELLAGAPGVTFLITSLEPLGLSGERVFHVEGMSYPHEKSCISLQMAERYSAVQLFCSCARRVQPDFVLSEIELPHVVRICQLVGGMPLGIEMAAAWVRTLSCAEIVAEITSSLDFLSTSLHDVPERHRSMRAVLEQSWNLLTHQERSALCKLSVFRGGFEREAAQQIADASLSILSALADKSLVHRKEARRYELHELVAQFGYDKLRESGEIEQTRARHAQYYLQLAEQAKSQLNGSERVQWLAWLENERDNIQAALE